MSELKEKQDLYNKAKTAYYDTKKPILTDEEFDLLEEYLIDNDPTFTPYVGTSNKENKYKHLSPMLSLSKVSLKVDEDGNELFDIYEKEITKWQLDMPKNSTYLWTPKYDGCSVNLQYENGKLKKAVTRGDKVQGRDVQARITNTVPKTLKTHYKNYDKLEVRGEIVLSKTIFQDKYSQFKNPRNLVSGFLSQKDIDKNISKDLTFIPFDIRWYENGVIFHEDLQSEKVINILKQDFPNSENEFDLFKTFTDAKEAYEFYKSYRENCDYGMDGIVVSIHSSKKEYIGYDHTSPKWAKAIKFPPKSSITEIIDIKWSLGKTGEFTPIGNVRPIELDGTIISNVSLYNFGTVINSGLSIGAKVSLEKAGDIIPKVKMILEKSENDFNYPRNCPECGVETIVDDIHLYCGNIECSGILEKKFVAATTLLKFDFLGEETSKKLFQSGLFKNVYDLIINFNNYKTKLVRNGVLPDGKILKSLSNSFNIKTIHIQKVIELLGEDGLGTRMSLALAKYHSGVNYDFTGFERKIIARYTSNDNELLGNIKLLQENNIQIEYIKEDNTMKQIVELTGSPKSFGFKTKDEFLKQTEPFGFYNGTLKAGVFALITDDKTSSSGKMQKATKLGIPVYEYQEFLDNFCK